MKKLIFFLPLFLFALADFSPCLKKYSFIQNSIPISYNLSLTFNKQNCIKYDPFTKMCFIQSKNKKIVKFFNIPKLAWWMASIKKNEIYIGNYAKEMFLFSPAKLSVKTLKNSVISDMFCRAYGAGRSGGFIEGAYINHFLKDGYWGDIGIDIDKNMQITSLDPFYVSGLKVGDKIKFINHHKATPERFAKYILLAKKDQIVTINKKYKIKVRKKIYLFTPLIHYGIEVDKNLIITKLPQNIKNRYFLQEGGKIIKVNNKNISSFNELKKALSYNKNVTITINFNGIILNIPLRK